MCSKTLYEPLLQYNTNCASVLGKHSCTFMREAVVFFTFGGSMHKYNCCFMQAHLCFNFWGSTVCFHAKSITILHVEAHTHVRCTKMMRKTKNEIPNKSEKPKERQKIVLMKTPVVRHIEALEHATWRTGALRPRTPRSLPGCRVFNASTLQGVALE